MVTLLNKICLRKAELGLFPLENVQCRITLKSIYWHFDHYLANARKPITIGEIHILNSKRAPIPGKGMSGY